MAISKKITFDYNSGICINIERAYIRIKNYSGDKENISIYVDLFLNEESFKIDKKENIGETKIYSFKPSIEENSKNFIKQGYEYLKTLEEYKDSIDLLDF